MIRWITAGESHGKGISTIIEGLPSGIHIDVNFINKELHRRQKGYGRGKRMDIESDSVQILSGVRNGLTLGTPVCMFIENKDYANWKDKMKIEEGIESKKVTTPRPGHGDLSGILKFGFDDIRNVIERASARETSVRVAGGAIYKLFLMSFGITFFSHTRRIKDITIEEMKRDVSELEDTSLRCFDPEKEVQMKELIDKAGRNGNTVGGISEVVAKGVCPGLGSYSHFDRRMDARIAQAMLSIPSVKGVEIGEAQLNSRRLGSQVHDEIFYNKKNGFYRKTNRAGGIEGGITNGEDIIAKLAIKPIPTLNKPLHSVDILTKKDSPAHKERADICVVPAVGVIGESMLAWVIMDLFLQKFGSDNVADIKSNFNLYLKRLEDV